MKCCKDGENRETIKIINTVFVYYMTNETTSIAIVEAFLSQYESEKEKEKKKRDRAQWCGLFGMV